MATNAKSDIMGAKFSRSQEAVLLQMFLGTTFGASLPTADPTNAGQLWSNAGVVTVSAG